MKNLKEKLSVWSLYYRQEMVWSVAGFIVGFILGALII